MLADRSAFSVDVGFPSSGRQLNAMWSWRAPALYSFEFIKVRYKPYSQHPNIVRTNHDRF